MAKTTVYIRLEIGAQQPAAGAYVSFRSPYRYVDGAVTVLPEPDPLRLGDDGTGTVSVDPGVWLVDEILPTQVLRRAVVVPESSSTVNYADLVEVTDPVEIGYGPSWAATALTATQSAQSAAASARAAAAQSTAALEQIRDVVDAIPTESAALALALSGNGPARTELLRTVSSAVSGPRTIGDAVGEWWIHPLATQLVQPYPRTVFGAVAKDGSILACEFNHVTRRTQRWDVGQAIVDDHCAPGLYVKPGRCSLIAWTKHNTDNYVRFKVGSASGDISSLVGAAEILYNLGSLASYSQIHHIAHLSNATQDTFYVVVRKANTEWGIIPVTVQQATKAVTFGTYKPLVSAPGRQCYLSTADAFNPAPADQVIRIGWGYNPAQPVHSIRYMELNVVTGKLTSPTVPSFTANLGNAVLDTDLNPLIPEPAAGQSRRFFYTRPGPDAPAVAYADGAADAPDSWVYKVQELDVTPASKYGGLVPNGGYASVPYRAAMSIPAGFEFQAVLKTPASAAVTEFGRSYTSGASAGFFLRLDANGRPIFTTYTSTGTVSWTAPMAIPGFQWGMELGLRLRVNPATGSASIAYSFDGGATWESLEDYRATFPGSGTMVPWTQPLAVPSAINTFAVAPLVRSAALLSLDGLAVASIDFRNAWDGTGTYTDPAGSVWSLSGGATIAPAPAPSGALGLLTTFGVAGPRVGFTPAANYIAGMAFECPSFDRKVITAHSANGLETVRVHRPSGNGYVAETLMEGKTADARLIRPYVPVNGTADLVGVTSMREYSPTTFTDYAGDWVLA